ncbi:MAG: nitroreductase/quinone reductase family protein [Chloroflexi bacterium]|nr:nitroreductase/quinone reductase family protein [Chloroflexota bacterium]
MMRKQFKLFQVVGNACVKRVLRTRFHWLLSRNVVLLEIKGRKSGRTLLVPVNYRQHGDAISVMTYRGRKWWLNLRDVTELPVYLKGERVLAVPEIITDDHEAIAAALVDRGWIRKSLAPPHRKQFSSGYGYLPGDTGQARRSFWTKSRLKRSYPESPDSTTAQR